jgi:hypothetical protein
MNFGKWKVYQNGDIDFDNGYYFIDGSRLQDEDWIYHLLEKNWVNMNDFLPAYFQALKNIDIELIQVRSFYK